MLLKHHALLRAITRLAGAIYKESADFLAWYMYVFVLLSLMESFVKVIEAEAEAEIFSFWPIDVGSERSHI